MNASPRAEIDAAIRAASRVFVLATRWERTGQFDRLEMERAIVAANAAAAAAIDVAAAARAAYYAADDADADAAAAAADAADDAVVVAADADYVAYCILQGRDANARTSLAELRQKLAGLGVNIEALERKARLHPNSRRRSSRRLRANAQDETREIKVYYEIVTPESAEEGDFAESGELSPIVLTHDDLDEDEPSWVDAAVRAISDNAGALEADAYGRGAVPSWFIESDGSTDYRTGANTRRSFIPKGFTPEEMVEMGRRLTGRYR